MRPSTNRRFPHLIPAVSRSGNARRAILDTRAVFKLVRRSGWRPARICLTPEGMTLAQRGQAVLCLPAGCILGIRTERMKVGLGSREVLRLDYRPTGCPGKRSRLWIVGTDLNALRESLTRLVAPFDRDAIEALLPRLDADSREIVELLWHERHATIRELARHTRMPSDTDILLRIREVINPLAEQSLGFPLLVFVPVRSDSRTGEQIRYSWWLTGTDGTEGPQRRGILVDVFEEAEKFSVLASLPCSDPHRVSVLFRENEVEILGGEGLEPAKVSLPTGVKPEDCQQSFRNGVLELRWDRSQLQILPVTG